MTTYKVNVDFSGEFVGTVSADGDHGLTAEDISNKLSRLFTEALYDLEVSVYPPDPLQLEITEANSVSATAVLKEA